MLDLTEADCGCYIEGHWGQYAPGELLLSPLCDDDYATCQNETCVHWAWA